MRDPSQRLFNGFDLYVLFGIFAISFLTRLIGLDSLLIRGDEFHSLSEIQNVGTNRTGILYFLLLHLWAKLSVMAWWLRLPSIFIGSIAASLGYVLGKVLVDRRVGFLMGGLLACSPLAVYNSQLIRFYSLFLMTSLLAFIIFSLYIHQKSARALVALLVANALCLSSHWFGVFVIAMQLNAFLLLSRISLRWKVAIPLFALIAPLIVVYSLGSENYDAFHDLLIRVQYGKEGIIPEYYAGPRGLGIWTVGKLGQTIFQFALGNAVYPLAIGIVAPTIVLHGLLAAFGLKRLKHFSLAKSLLISGLIALVIAFFGVDVLGPSQHAVYPHYLYFLLPFYFLLLSLGVTSSSLKIVTSLTVLLITINLVGLWEYWRGDWYTSMKPRYRDIVRLLPSHDSIDLYAGGRALVRVKEYLSDAENINKMDSVYKLPLGSPREELPEKLLLVFSDSRPDVQQGFNALLRRVEEDYYLVDNLVRFPIFAFRYQKKGTGDKEVEMFRPQELFGVEFSDFRLPRTIEINSKKFVLTTPFTIDGGTKKEILLPRSASQTQMCLLSNLTTSTAVPDGTPIGNIITWGNGKRIDLPIIKGTHTFAWDAKERQGGTSLESAKPVVFWRKRMHLVGQRAYRGAHKDFEAAIFLYKYDLPDGIKIDKLTVQVLAPNVRLHIWGVFYD